MKSTRPNNKDAEKRGTGGGGGGEIADRFYSLIKKNLPAYSHIHHSAAYEGMADDAATTATATAPTATHVGQWKDVHLPLTVKVFQWNVLADCCADATPEGFPFVPPAALNERRRPLQIKEILDADADVVALEEVDAPHDFEEALKEHEYEVMYNKREDSPLGVLVAYKSKYKLVQKSLITFSRGGQVATIVKLKDPSCNRAFVFAATHLKAKSNVESVSRRMYQSVELREHVVNMSDDCHDRLYSWNTREAKMTGNVIVAGDFNDTPESRACQTWFELDGFGSVFPRDDNTTFKLRQTATGGRLKKVCVEDYIFHTGRVKRRRELVQTFPAPYLPSTTFPSDHLSLCAEIVFVD